MIAASLEKLVQRKWKYQGAFKIDSYIRYLALLTEYGINENYLDKHLGGRLFPDDIDPVTKKEYYPEDTIEMSWFTFEEFFEFMEDDIEFHGYVNPEAWKRFQSGGAYPEINEFSTFSRFAEKWNVSEEQKWTVKKSIFYQDLIQRVKETCKDEDPKNFRMVYVMYL